MPTRSACFSGEPSSQKASAVGRWRDWRAAVDRSSLLRSSGGFATFDVSKFNVFDLVEGSTNRGAVCGTVAIDFSQCVVAANFGAAKQALNALECF